MKQVCLLTYTALYINYCLIEKYINSKISIHTPVPILRRCAAVNKLDPWACDVIDCRFIIWVYNKI